MPDTLASAPPRLVSGRRGMQIPGGRKQTSMSRDGLLPSVSCPLPSKPGLLRPPAGFDRLAHRHMSLYLLLAIALRAISGVAGGPPPPPAVSGGGARPGGTPAGAPETPGTRPPSRPGP